MVKMKCTYLIPILYLTLIGVEKIPCLNAVEIPSIDQVHEHLPISTFHHIILKLIQSLCYISPQSQTMIFYLLLYEFF